MHAVFRDVHFPALGSAKDFITNTLVPDHRQPRQRHVNLQIKTKKVELGNSRRRYSEDSLDSTLYFDSDAELMNIPTAAGLECTLSIFLTFARHPPLGLVTLLKCSRVREPCQRAASFARRVSAGASNWAT